MAPRRNLGNKRDLRIDRDIRYSLSLRAIRIVPAQHPLQLHGSEDNYRASYTLAGECLINAIREIFRLDIFAGVIDLSISIPL